MDKKKFSQELDNIIEKNQSFNISTQKYAEMLKDKNKFNQLKDVEGDKLQAFYFRYAHYIEKEKQQEVFKIFDNAEKLEKLILEKFHGSNINTPEEVKHVIKIADLTFSNKIRTFDTIYDLISSGLKRKVLDGRVDKFEANLFDIELKKRNLEKEAFLNLKEARFEEVSKSLDIKSHETAITKPLSKDKPRAVKAENSGEESSSLETSGIENKTSVSEEIIKIAKEMLDLFL